MNKIDGKKRRRKLKAYMEGLIVEEKRARRGKKRCISPINTENCSGEKCRRH